MAVYDVSAASRPPIVIGATGVEAVLQNVRMILSTLIFSVPLDRAFCASGSFLDAPSPYEAQRRMAEIVDIVEANEPRVRVTDITLEALAGSDAMDGILAPVVHIALREGVEL